MKIITREILPFQEKDFFFSIRDKIDYIKLIINSARIIIINLDLTDENSTCSLKLIKDKMSRLFFYNDSNFFSVSFPFHVIELISGEIEIKTYSGKILDNKNISTIHSIINNEQFRINPSPIDFLMESTNYDLLSFSLLEEIMFFEPAYVRYDYDLQNENGKLHPKHHLDINYSSYCTYKFGINKGIDTSHFENILNINTECSFIND